MLRYPTLEEILLGSSNHHKTVMLWGSFRRKKISTFNKNTKFLLAMNFKIRPSIAQVLFLRKIPLNKCVGHKYSFLTALRKGNVEFLPSLRVRIYFFHWIPLHFGLKKTLIQSFGSKYSSKTTRLISSNKAPRSNLFCPPPNVVSPNKKLIFRHFAHLFTKCFSHLIVIKPMVLKSRPA